MRACLRCGAAIAECMGAALARDVAAALAGRLPWRDVRELCARCNARWDVRGWRDPRDPHHALERRLLPDVG